MIKNIYFYFLILLITLNLVSCVGGSDNTATQTNSGTITKKTLEIDIFGNGSIDIIGNHNLDCSIEGLCKGSYEKGSTLTLKATSSSGWTFDNWGMCGSVSGDTCTLTLDNNTLLTADFISSTPLEIYNNVLVLSDSQLREITEYNKESGLIVFQSGTNTDQFNVGTILISKGIYLDKDNPDNYEIYFARRIKKIIAIPGSPIIIDTLEASLADIIKKGTLNYDDNLDSSKITSLPKGLKLRKFENKNTTTAAKVIPLSIDIVLFDKDGNETTTDDQIKAKGTIDFTVDLDGDINFKVFHGVTEVRFVGDIKTQFDLELIIGGEVPFKKGEKHLKAISFAPIIIGPVVIVPDLVIKFAYEAKASAAVKPGIKLTTKIGAGVHWIKDHGWRNLGSFDVDPDLKVPSITDPLLAVKATLEAGPKAEVGFKFYNVAGPVIGVAGFGGFEIFPVIPAKTDCLIDYSTYVGAAAFFKGKIDILSKEFSYEAKIAEGKWPISSLSNGCSDPDTERPLPPENLSVDNQSAESLDLNWTDATDNAGIKGYEIYRDNTLLSSGTVGNNYMDRTLNPVTEYCYYIYAIDTSGNKSEVSSTVCGITRDIDSQKPDTPINIIGISNSTSSLELSWDKSNDNIAVNGYIILDDTDTQNPPYIVQRTTEEGSIITGLSPDTEYCYIVSALDQAGNISSPSQRKCYTTLPIEQAAWTMLLACQNRDYLLEQKLDLDENKSSSVSVTSEGKDYNGTRLVYSLTGIYDSNTSQLDADIFWTFENSDMQRRDVFVADLSVEDTGDINMNQVEKTGCDAMIRLIKNSSSKKLHQNPKQFEYSNELFLSD